MRRGVSTIRIFTLAAVAALAFVLVLPGAARAQNEEADAIKGQIAQLQAQIDELQGKVDGMLAPSQQEERNKLREQIKVLERQLRVKMFEFRNLNRSQSARQADAIRAKYRDQIRALEEQRAAARREAISKFEQILGEAGQPANPGVMFRLSQLYFEESYYQYQRVLDGYDEQIEAGQDPGPPPQVDYSRSIDLYRRVINEFPDYSNVDATYYLLAYALMESERVDEAIESYQTLIERYPDSEYVPESHVRLGEIYFDRGEFNRALYDQAIGHYKQVKPSSRFYDKALYKLGWTYYKLGSYRDKAPYDTAIDYFLQVLRYYHARPSRSLAGGDDLRKESIDYIAISFSEFGDEGFARAERFFNQNTVMEWNAEILMKMADVYFANSEFEEARRAANLYLDRYPEDARNPQVHMKIVESYEREGRWDEAITESERMASLYGPQSAWAEKNKGERKALARAEKTRRGNLLAAATYHHERAQKATDPAAARQEYVAAIASYEALVNDYPEGESSYQAMFQLAEAYYYSDQYASAAEAYHRVASMNPDGKFYRDARFNRVKAWEKQVETEGGLPNKDLREQVVKGGQDMESIGEGRLQQVPLSTAAQSYITALVDYAPEAQAPNTPGDYVFEAGRVQFWHGNVAEANRLFDQVMRDYPGTKAAAAAKFYAIEGAKVAGDYERIQTIIAANPAADATERAREQQIVSTAGLIMAGKLADEGNYAQAIGAYQEAYESAPTSPDAPVALHNTAVILETKLGRIKDANVYLEKVAVEYPKYEQAADDLFHAAVNYERIADFDGAQRAYANFQQVFPQHKDAKNALYNATVLAIKDRDFNQALNLARQYAAAYPGAADRGELIFLTALGMEAADQEAQAAGVYREYAGSFQNDAGNLVQAYAKVGEYEMGAGNSDEAVRNFNLAVGVFERVGSQIPEARKYAAMSKFYLLQPTWNEYQALKFTGDVAADTELLKRKAEMLKNLKDGYEAIATYGDFEYLTAAVYMVGMINREFSESLFQAPVPEDISPEQQDEYIIQLEDIAFPIKQRAQEAFKKNIEKGEQERVRNEWIDKSVQMYRLYDPNFQDQKFETPAVGAPIAFSGATFDLESKASSGATP
ncbi:tetratricopeptide repeat protein [bacterium]|nr:tetratricopeptide repeat protein [bacterium]